MGGKAVDITLIILFLCCLLLECSAAVPPRPTNGVRLYDEMLMNEVLSFSKLPSTSLTNKLWCQSSASAAVGTWFFPNGTAIQNDTNSLSLRVIEEDGQIGLFTDVEIDFTTKYWGLYVCIIPDELNVNQTLTVGIFSKNFFTLANAPVVSEPQFNLLSSLDADTPTFTIVFNVTERPPTIVTCSVDNSMVDYTITRVIESPLNPIEVIVTATFNTRRAGSFVCEVSTNNQSEQISNSKTDPVNITVPGAPINLSLMRSDLKEITLTWSPPLSSPTPSGYEVFYELSDGIRRSEVIRDGETMFTQQVDILQNFTAFVVAYVDIATSLPSVRSNSTEISQGLSISISGLTSSISYSDNATLVCEGESFIAGLSIVSLGWVDPNGVIVTEDGSQGGPDTPHIFIDNYLNLNTSATLDLELRNVLLSHSGVYTCVMSYEVGNDRTAMLNVTQDIFIQVPAPLVTVTINYSADGFAFDTGQVALLCSGILQGFDNDTLTPNPSITWSSNGSVISNSTEYSISMQTATILDSMYQVNSILSKNVLDISTDNGTVYNCTVEVGVSTLYDGYEYVESNAATGSSPPLTIEDLPDIKVAITVLGDPVIGNTVQLICNANITTGITLSTADLMLRWLYNDTLIQPTESSNISLNISDNGDQLVLTVESVDRDLNGLYSCQGTLTVEGVATSIQDMDTYDFIAIGTPSVKTVATGSMIAGSSNYTLLCSVSVDDSVPIVDWLDPMGQVLPNTNFTNNGGLDSILELAFLPTLEYSSAGLYTCRAVLVLDIGNFSVNQTQLVTIGIPPLAVTITGITGPAVSEGTQQVLTCTVSPTDPLPTPLSVSIDWTRTNAFLEVDGTRVSTNHTDNFTSQLVLAPVGGADSGGYTCTVIVYTTLQNVLNATGLSTTNLTVEDLPSSSLDFASTGSSLIGEPLVLTCSVNTTDNLYSSVTVNSSIVYNGTVLNYTETNGDSTVQVTLDPLLIPDTGDYTCKSSVIEMDIDLSVSDSKRIIVIGMMPESTVYLSTTPIATESYLEGTSVYISCLVNVSSLVVEDAEISIEWSLNGTILTNSTRYTINSVVMPSDTQYSSTLQINELISTDNGSVYYCNASLSSSNVYLSGSTSNGSTTLRVDEFTSDHIEVSLTKPLTSAVAGDEVVLNCSVSVPSGFLPMPSNITYSYNSTGSPSITALSTVQSGIISGSSGNLYYSTLLIGPVRTSNAQMYFCVAEFSDFSVTASDNVSLPVKIPSSTISIDVTPSVPIYESTQVNLTCSVSTSINVDTNTDSEFVWINGETGTTITSDDRVTISSSGPSNSVLMFNPIDNGDRGEYNDTGSYTCQVNVTDGNSDPLVLTGMANQSYLLLVKDLPQFSSPSVSYSGSDVIGDNTTLSCNISVPSGLVGNISLSWTKDNDSMSVYGTSGVSEATITFDPLSYGDRGRYMCTFTYLSAITNDNVSLAQSYDLVIQIPAVSIEATNNQNGMSSYTGTILQLGCIITLSPLVGNPINVMTVWNKNGDTNILNNRISSNQTMVSIVNYTSNLVISPLSGVDDSGLYQCNVTVTGDEYVVPVYGHESIDISVQALPSPIVSISIPGNSPLELGLPYTLQCFVEVVEDLVVEPITSWTKRSVDDTVTDYAPSLNVVNDSLVSGNNTNTTLMIPVLRTSDAGNYTCTSVLKVTSISVTVSGDDSLVLPITLPTPSVSTNFSWEGSYLRISCLINVSMYIDTPTYINVSWSHKDVTLTNDSRTLITDPVRLTENSNLYRSDYRLDHPNLNDTREYSCSVTLEPMEGFLHLMSSDMYDSSVSVSISAPSEPVNFIVAGNTPTSLVLKWDSPLEPNGPITNYTLTIDYSNGTIVSTTILESNYTVGGLYPYQLITVQVSASTIVGTGPQSNLTIRTQQDTPSSVGNLKALGLDAMRAFISWSDVEVANGVIVQYRVLIQPLGDIGNSAIHTLEGAELSNNITISDLSGETPYKVSVFAINGAIVDNASDPSQLIFFTIEGAPPPPDGFSVTRLNGTHMSVTWDLIPLTDSRGFIEAYVVTYTIQDGGSRNRRNTGSTSMVNVSSSESSVVIGGLVPVAQYTVQVAAVTGVGQGSFSGAIMSGSPPSEGFQVRAGPFRNCTDIDSSYEDMVMIAIQSQLVSVITNVCNCGFSSLYIDAESLNCIMAAPTQVVYRANITGYNDVYTSSRLIEIIEDYVSSDPSVTSNSLSFTFDSLCVTLFEQGDEVCGDTPPTDPPTAAPSETDQTLVYVIIAAVLGVLLAFGLFLFVLICIIMKYRKNKKVPNDNIELMGYSTVVRRESNGVKESSAVAINGRNSELLSVDNQLYADATVTTPTTVTGEEALYADLTNVNDQNTRSKVELQKDGTCSLDNALYAISKEEDSQLVVQNGLYASPDEIDDTKRVLQNTLYSDVDHTDFAPSQIRSNSETPPTHRYEYTVVNKVREKEKHSEVIENKGFEYTGNEPPPEYAVVDKKTSDPIDIDGNSSTTPTLAPETAGGDQYEAPWSAKYRSLNRQSAPSEQNTPKTEYDDVVVKPKVSEETAKTPADDQYEAPWSAKYRSLNRQSTLNEQNTPKEYDDVVVKPKPLGETPKIPADDQYEAPWSAKYRSLNRQSTLSEQNDVVVKPNGNSQVSVGFPPTTAATQQLSDQPTTTSSTPQEPPNDTYEVPWASKTRSLGRKQQTVDKNTATQKDSGSPSTNLPSSLKGNEEDQYFVLNEYETPLHQPSPPPLPPPHPSMIASNYDEICMPPPPPVPPGPHTKPSTSSGTPPPPPGPRLQQPSNNTDTYSVPMDSLDQQRHQSDTPVSKPVPISKNRRRVRSIPSKVVHSSSIQEDPLMNKATDEYSIPFGSKTTSENPGEDDVYSVPFSDQVTHSVNQKHVSFSSPETSKATVESDRHLSVGEGEGKKRSRIFSFGFKNKKIIKPKGNAEDNNDTAAPTSKSPPTSQLQGEELYETIITAKGVATGQSSLNQTDSSTTAPDLPPLLPPSRSSMADKSKSSYLNSIQQSEYAVPIDNKQSSSVPMTTMSPPPLPNRPSMAEKSKANYLESHKEQNKITNASETYSDPADTITPTTTSIAPSSEPSAYEAPITKQDQMKITNSNDLYTDPADMIKQSKSPIPSEYEAPITKQDHTEITNANDTYTDPADMIKESKSPVPSEYEAPITKQDQQVNIEPYDAVVFHTQDSSTPSPPPSSLDQTDDNNDPSTDTHVYSETVKLEDDDIHPKVPQPYEIPVSTKKDIDITTAEDFPIMKPNIAYQSIKQRDDETLPMGDNDTHVYNDTVKLNGKDNEDLPKKPQTYEIPVSTKEENRTGNEPDNTPITNGSQPYEDPTTLVNNDDNS